MFYYEGRPAKLLSHYTYDPDYEEWRREKDILVAYVLDYEIKFEYSELSDRLLVYYRTSDGWRELPYYMSDMNAALSLFTNEPGLVITMNLVLNSADKVDRPLGEWWDMKIKRRRLYIYQDQAVTIVQQKP